MSSVQGKVVAITGAGSGIGRQLAFEMAKRGAQLAISDVNDVAVQETADRARALGAAVYACQLDVSDRSAVLAHAEAVVAHFGVVHQIINNAGVAGSGRSVLDADWSSYDRVLGINLFGVLHGTKAFLPHLVASGDGHVVNISSINGIVAQPLLSEYVTSKFAVRGFSEALRTELLLEGHPVRVTVVHPGGVRTGIADSALLAARDAGAVVTARDEARRRTYDEKMLTMPAERAARIIVDAVVAGRGRVLVGRDAKALDLLARVMPRRYPAVMVKGERRLFGDA